MNLADEKRGRVTLCGRIDGNVSWAVSIYFFPSSCSAVTHNICGLFLCLHLLPGERHRECPGSEVTLPPLPGWPFWSRALLRRMKEEDRRMNEWGRWRRFSGGQKARFLCLLWEINEWKLTGVCFIVPNEPLGQKPDDQSWKENMISVHWRQKNLGKICVKLHSCSQLTYISRVYLTCVAGIFLFRATLFLF